MIYKLAMWISNCTTSCIPLFSKTSWNWLILGKKLKRSWVKNMNRSLKRNKWTGTPEKELRIWIEWLNRRRKRAKWPKIRLKTKIWKSVMTMKIKEKINWDNKNNKKMNFIKINIEECRKLPDRNRLVNIKRSCNSILTLWAHTRIKRILKKQLKKLKSRWICTMLKRVYMTQPLLDKTSSEMIYCSELKEDTL